MPASAEGGVAFDPIFRFFRGNKIFVNGYYQFWNKPLFHPMPGREPYSSLFLTTYCLTKPPQKRRLFVRTKNTEKDMFGERGIAG